MQEIWLPIKGYENYHISNIGRVKSLERTDSYTLNGKTIYRHKKEIILKQCYDGNGYLMVRLFNTVSPKGRLFKVHRLVGEVFIPNPNNLPCINHIDEDKTNNVVENLEWCDVSYNNKYGTRLTRAIEKEKIPIEAFDTYGNIILQFESVNEAKRNGFLNAGECCRGKYKTCGGYKWRYVK